MINLTGSLIHTMSFHRFLKASASCRSKRGVRTDSTFDGFAGSRAPFGVRKRVVELSLFGRKRGRVLHLPRIARLHDGRSSTTRFRQEKRKLIGIRFRAPCFSEVCKFTQVSRDVPMNRANRYATSSRAQRTSSSRSGSMAVSGTVMTAMVSPRALKTSAL